MSEPVCCVAVFWGMPFQRRRPRIPANGRVTLWLNPAQRDLFVHSPDTPKMLSHLLHHAPVTKGKLTIRVTRESLDALIATAARFSPQTAGEDRAIATLLRYLESLEERFAEVSDDTDSSEE
jgi:hypothetical protein